MTEQPLRITLIDDDEDYFVLVRDLLADAQGICSKLTWHDSYEKGLSAIGGNHTDVFLVDYRLGAKNGLDLFQAARKCKVVTPFILLTGQGDQEIAVEAMKAGATDYLVKGQIDAPLLERSLRHAVETAKHRTLVGRFVDIMESTNDFVASCDAGTLITYMNRAGRRMLGIGEDEDLSATSVSQVHPPVSAELIARIAMPTAGRNGHWNGETELKARDGRRIPVLQTIIAHKSANGTIEYYSTTCRDISERKQAEQSQARLATAVEQSADVIIVTDAQAVIQYVNPAFERVTGYSQAESVGQNPRLLKSGRQGPEVYQEMWSRLTEGKAWSGQLSNRRKNGSLYEAESTITPVRNQDGKIINFVAVSRDVTYQRSIEEQLRQSQKMQAVGRLAGGIAHDFNNILTVINGYCAMLSSTTPDDGLRGKGLEAIQKSADRASALTRQLLAFSRKQLLNPKVLNLNQVIIGMSEMLQRLIGENIELRPHLAENLSCVKADAGQIEQVIMNMAVNSRDAMPLGGKLVIETMMVQLEGLQEIPPADLVPGDYVRITISDNGMGMTDQVKAHLFEPFFTTKGVGQGTGLGLATSYGIIKQSGGHITVYSEPGHGTAFKIYLPAVAESVKQKPTATTLPPPKGHETILLVEDEEALRTLGICILQNCGYTVLTACNGRDGAELAKTNRERIDLIITDVIMPLMGGKDMVKEIKPIMPRAQIMFMSGYTDDALAEHGVLDPGICFLEKPFTPTRLANKVREVLDQSELA